MEDPRIIRPQMDRYNLLEMTQKNPISLEDIEKVFEEGTLNQESAVSLEFVMLRILYRLKEEIIALKKEVEDLNADTHRHHIDHDPAAGSGRI